MRIIAKVETGMVRSRPMPKMRRPKRFRTAIASQNKRRFQKLPRVMAQLSFIEAMGPILVSTRIKGEREKRTTQMMPGTMSNMRPAKTVRGKRIETPRNFQNRGYSEKMSLNLGCSPSEILK
jgi:hypothetical protein